MLRNVSEVIWYDEQMNLMEIKRLRACFNTGVYTAAKPEGKRPLLKQALKEILCFTIFLVLAELWPFFEKIPFTWAETPEWNSDKSGKNFKRSWRKNRTLFESENIDGGIYLGPTLHYSKIIENDGLYLGARLGWIANHRWVIGAAISGLINDFHHSDRSEREAPVQRPAKTGISLGGILVEHIFIPDRIVHVSVGGILGGGYIFIKNRKEADTGLFPSQAVFFVKPEVQLLVNLTVGVKIAWSVGYQWVRGSRVSFLTNSDISGIDSGLQLQFGIF